MSGIIGSATIAMTTVITVFAAAYPEITNAILPITENGNEYAAYGMGLLVTIPGLLLLTTLAAAARD